MKINLSLYMWIMTWYGLWLCISCYFQRIQLYATHFHKDSTVIHKLCPLKYASSISFDKEILVRNPTNNFLFWHILNLITMASDDFVTDTTNSAETNSCSYFRKRNQHTQEPSSKVFANLGCSAWASIISPDSTFSMAFHSFQRFQLFSSWVSSQIEEHITPQVLQESVCMDTASPMWFVKNTGIKFSSPKRHCSALTMKSPSYSSHSSHPHL